MSSVPPPPATTPPRFARSCQIGGRTEQQDASETFYQPSIGTALMIVCDGVGGSRAGQLASSTVLETARQLWDTRQGHLPDPHADLIKLCQIAHERIQSLAMEGEKRSPASTIVALYLTATEAHWVHSGDSRLYHFRAGQLVSRTRDHSVVQVLVDQGEVAEEAMGCHPDQGRLLQSLGTNDFREPTYGSSPVGPDDAFLLCTDGFWERTRLASIISLLYSAPPLASGLDQLVAAAVAANGEKSDNVSAIAIGPSRPASSALLAAPRPSAKVHAAIICALVASLAFVAWSAWQRFHPQQGIAPAQDPPAQPSPSPEHVPAKQTPPIKRGGEATVTTEVPKKAETTPASGATPPDKGKINPKDLAEAQPETSTVEERPPQAKSNDPNSMKPGPERGPKIANEDFGAGNDPAHSPDTFDKQILEDFESDGDGFVGRSTIPESVWRKWLKTYRELTVRDLTLPGLESGPQFPNPAELEDFCRRLRDEWHRRHTGSWRVEPVFGPDQAKGQPGPIKIRIRRLPQPASVPPVSGAPSSVQPARPFSTDIPPAATLPPPPPPSSGLPPTGRAPQPGR